MGFAYLDAVFSIIRLTNHFFDLLQFNYCIRISLLGYLAIPVNRLSIVTRHTFSIIVSGTSCAYSSDSCLLSYIDAIKVRSCMTLFDLVSSDDIFRV